MLYADLRHGSNGDVRDGYSPQSADSPKTGHDFFAAILASNMSGRIYPREVLVKCECAQKGLISLNV